VKPFDLITVVWGAAYRQLFLDVCVPNQLTAGNLGALPTGSRYRIFTTHADAAFIEAHESVRAVSQTLRVDIVVAPELATDEDQFVKLTACHARAVKDAREAGAAFIVLSPDIVISEGTLAAVVRQHRAGARAVVCTGLRIEKDGFLAALRARGSVRDLPARELVALALGYPHPYTEAHAIDHPQVATRPIGVCWNVPGEGFVVRPFYLHPLMVDPSRDYLPGETTIDHHYLVHALPERDRIHVVTDSDELQVFELSHVDAAKIDLAEGPMTPWRAAGVLCRCDAHQETYWRESVRIHAGEVGAAWRPIETAAARFAAITRGLSLPAYWVYRGSRRIRPVRRRLGSLIKQLRRRTKDWRRRLRMAH
jgi:hypothetical protein